MYYIEQEDDELVKYEVEIEEDKLKKLKGEIVKECGEIKHRSYDGITGPIVFDYIHIKNYHEIKIGRTESNDDLFYPPEYIYHFEYDEYKDTKLVTIINRLMDGDTNTILELKNPQPEEKVDEEKQIKEQIAKLHSEMSNADNLAIIRISDKVNSLVQQLKKIEQDKLRNLNRKSDLEYYPPVLECITLKEVARIKIETLEEFNLLSKEAEAFFALTTSEKINPDINKELYKRLIIK